MKSLWLDIGNTRLKYWITENQQIIEHAAELHLQSPADLLLGLIQHFKHQGLHRIGISSVLDTENNQRIQQILKWLEIPVVLPKCMLNMQVYNVAMKFQVSSGLTAGYRYLLLLKKKTIALLVVEQHLRLI